MRIDVIVDGVNLNDVPDVLLSVDYSTGTRVWTLTVNGVPRILSQPFDLYTAMDISAAFIAECFRLDVDWQTAGPSGYTLGRVRRLDPGETPKADSVARLLASVDDTTAVVSNESAPDPEPRR